MTDEDLRLLQKRICKDASVIKYGTYSIGKEIGLGETADVYMPPSSEDFIQNSIDAMVREHDEQEAREKEAQDAKIAEIMNMFSSNIQNNVNSLFDNP